MAVKFLLKDLLVLLDELAAPTLAEDWDNVGLMVGDPGAEVSGVLVALDPTMEVLAEAGQLGCNTIVTHHPLIFKPLTGVRLDEPESRILAQAISSGLAVVSAHTNLDKIAGGVNDMLARVLGLVDLRPLVPEGRDGEAALCGFGRVGNLSESLSFSSFAGLVKTRLGLTVLPVAGRPPERILTVAVCGGSGSELAPVARQAGAQVYLSGEIKHSTARWAESTGFCLLDGGHFATEQVVVPALAAILRQRLAGAGAAVPVLGTERQGSPFRIY